MKTFEDSQNRNVTGMSNAYIPVSRAAKTHQDYWKARIKRCTFRGRDGEKYTPPEYYVRMFHEGREAWFCLDTANQSIAIIKARDIYLSLISAGWAATLAKFKPSSTDKADVCTVGEFLADVQARSHLKPMTVRRYAVKLRKMVSDVAKLEAGVRGRAKRAKYDYMNGGRKAWLAKVDKQPLDVLTPDTVNAWRNHYVAKAGIDPIKRKSAERSAASYLRCSRALFTTDVVSVLKVKLPSNPFDGVKLKDPGPQRYHSEVNPEWLLACAALELRQTHPQQYLALFLCLWAGLRRKEADLLTWEQIDFKKGEIHVRRTPYFEPKTEESQRNIDLAPEALNVLGSFKKGSTSEFVLDGAEPNLFATYDYYRCDCTWRDLNAWLRKKGVHQVKAIHALRKESGSLIASTFGIEAARQHLGHRDIRTTSAHYVDKKKRIEVQLPLGTELRAIEG
ncbi:MAG TPA: tyrosine-type recombinase/integrase [Opitutaceae bacterium]|jgi:integrase|nr:tyrosine-type recombinase/integrase [Opitutaceae bacterium]